MNREQTLHRRIYVLTWIFILGLFFSGITAIPLRSEVDCLVRITGAQELVQNPGSTSPPDWAVWLIKVQTALHELELKNGFSFTAQTGWPSAISSSRWPLSERCVIPFATRG